MEPGLAQTRIVAAMMVAALMGACDGTDTPLPDGGSSGDQTDACADVGWSPISQSNFDGFTTWTKFNLGSDAGGDELGDVGDRIVYINKLPPHGSTTFPVGTILVKTAGYGTPDAGPTFAMAKQGRFSEDSSVCFNASGAKGWVWFELQPTARGATIGWSGAAQPTADTYGAAGVSCNACHAGAASNDYVPAAPLALTNF